MNRIVILIVTTAILASVLLAFYGREDFYLIAIIGFVTLLISAFSLLGTLILLILGKTNKSRMILRASKYAGLLLVVSLILFSSVLIASKIAEYDVKQAKVFCESLIVKIEQYKSINGKYPDTIDNVISDDIKLPVRIENYSFYQTNGIIYRFVIPVIGPNASGYVYDSRDKNWELADFIFDLERL